MKKPVLLALVLILLSPMAQAELILTAPPRETPEKGAKMYGPIAEHLSRQLGETVTYQHPGNWAKYAEDMRKDRYDIVFDGPHFAAWRIKHLNHRVTGRLPGSLVFVIVSRASDKSIKNIRSLRGKRTCGLPSPNLGTVYFLSQFQSTVTPDVVTVKGGFKKVYAAFKKGQCDAAIMRDTVYNKLPKAEKDRLQLVHTSTSLPNQVFTVSNRVHKFTQVTDALVSARGVTAAQDLLQRFSKNTRKILAAQTKEYRGAEQYLEGVIWGW